jgi:deoxyribodipyrimidine photolyase
MDIFALLFPTTAAQIHHIAQKVDTLVASFEEAKTAWIDYANNLKTQRDEAVAALESAQGRAQEAADQLAQFQSDDAATDAQQLADQAAAFAQELQDALDSVQDAPEEPEPLPEPPTEETPTEEPA